MNTTPTPLPPQPGTAGSGRDVAAHEFLSFVLGSETYGIDIRQVQEVRSYEAPTGLPQARPWLLGVTNLRGVIVPVVDLRVKLGLVPRFDEHTVTAVLNLGGRTIGVVVDSVSDVVELPASRIKAPPPSGQGLDAVHVRGLAEVGTPTQPQLLIVLDAESLLRDMTPLDTGSQHAH